MHSGRCAGVPLNKLRQLPRAGMGGVGGIFVNTDSDESGGEEEGRRRRGRVVDPRRKRVQRWNRGLLIARGMALAVDPLFFYALSVGRDGTPCLYMDGGLAAIVAAARTVVDVVHVAHVWLQFRTAYVSKESMVVGCGKLVWDARAIAAHYMRSMRGFWFDAFVILPIPQVTYHTSQINLYMTYHMIHHLHSHHYLHITVNWFLYYKIIK